MLMIIRVHRFLVTAAEGPKFDLWSATSFSANWIEGRPNGERETWLVTVFDEDAGYFLNAARTGGVTVEEIEGAGDSEQYVMRVGEQGTGWKP
jgi:nitrogenase molybdenum-iron protein alpha/beta subunit